MTKQQIDKDKALALYWIEDNVGVSSTAIFLYMTLGKVPGAGQAPSDNGDRKRCVALLRARPEWIDRLQEIEEKKIGQIVYNGINNEITFPWEIQIPLIRKMIEKSNI